MQAAEKRAYTKKCVNEIRHAFHNNRGSLWRVLDNISNASSAVNSEPSDLEFYHFKYMSIPRPPDDCDTNYEEAAIAFIHRYDSGAKIAGNSHTGTLMEEIINSNFTCDEIECAIHALKSHKSPGMDRIPAELIKSCKNTLAETIALNYIIEHRDFPQTWTSVIRSAVYKNGQKCQVNNFRGITITHDGKIFEKIVYR